MCTIPEDKINIRKKISKLHKESDKESNINSCYICKKNIKGKCNSHSIPQFILKNIATNGYVYSQHYLNPEINQIAKGEYGINNAKTFHRICKNCDNTYFKSYESEEALEDLISELSKDPLSYKAQFILSKIMQKELLFHLCDEQRNSYVMHLLLGVYPDEHTEYKQNYLEDCNLFSQCIDVIDGKEEMILYDSFELDYTTSIASQSLIFLYKDLYQRVINDLFSTVCTYTLIPTCWCIFPMKCKTLILNHNLQT